MKIERSVLQRIVATVGSAAPETGGVLGIKDGVVCEFYFDESAIPQAHEYCPNTGAINAQLEEWAQRGIAFAGIIHSHPNGCALLSKGDTEGIATIVNAIPRFERLYFPIVTNEGGVFSMSVYCVSGAGETLCISEEEYEVTQEDV